MVKPKPPVQQSVVGSDDKDSIVSETFNIASYYDKVEINRNITSEMIKMKI